MSNVTLDMLNFLSKDECTAEIQQVIDKIGYKNFRIISIEIISWMKRQNKYKNNKPLRLRFDYEWCRSLEAAVEIWPELNNLIEINETECNFRGSVREEERTDHRELAEKFYQPVLRHAVFCPHVRRANIFCKQP